MRIAVDLSPLSRPFPLGVQRVVRSAVAALEEHQDVDLVGISPPAGASLLRWRQTGLVREARTARADVLHSWTSAFPLWAPMPVTQTVHEAPWRHGASENAGWGHRLWARWGQRRAALVFTPSSQVARDLGGHARLRVVPWGVDPAFRSEPAAIHSNESDLPADFPTGPFVLVLGGTRPKKRLHLAAAATGTELAAVAATGPITEYATKLAQRHPHLQLLGELEEGRLPALVRRAACVAVLSESEGFALPVLEAMASGTPVVCARGTVQAETAGGFAWLADADDPGDVRRQIIDAAQEPRLSARLCDAQAFAASHTWSSCAASLVAAWRTITAAQP